MDIASERLIELITEELNAYLNRKTESPIKPSVLQDETREVKVVPESLPASESPACKAATSGAEAILRRMRTSTAARIGIGRAGSRIITNALLDFRADHAAARDSVFRDVSDKFLDRMGLFSVRSRCADKNEFLTRPDLGRLICPKSEKLLLEKCKKNPRVQIFAAGGLSSVAIEANLENCLPVLTDGLNAKGIEVGTPFYAHLARVGFEDSVSALLNPEVVCVLIGERPGLMTAESMSAYIAYRAEPGMPESRRTVVSNIHKGGVSAVEAGAYLADLIEQILKAKKSGVDFRQSKAGA